MATRKDKTANRKAAAQVKEKPVFAEHPIYDSIRKDTGLNPFQPWEKSVLITERPEFKDKEVKVRDIADARAARQLREENGDAEPGES